MSAITQAGTSKLPAHIAAIAGVELDDSLTTGISSGYPVVSIRGRAWRIVQNGEERLVTLPDSDDPAPSIEVVILKANKGLSKVYYAKAYEEGSDSAPDCFSHDGVEPDPSVENPQSARCQSCKQNAWGSKITPAGTKIKACSDSRRLAIVPAGDLENPMLLRVPAASLAELAEYGRSLTRRGVPYHAVITKLGFDTQAAYPKLTFRPVRFVDEEQFSTVNATRGEAVIDEIIGATLRSDSAPRQAPAAAPAAAPKAAEPAPDPDLAFEQSAPAQKADKPKAPRKAQTKVEPEPAVAADSVQAEVEDMLKGFDI